jgi:hypothetical protein
MKNPLTIIFLLPAVLSLYYVVRGYIEKAFLYVYLPALLGLPFYYVCQLPHMPPLSAAEAVLIPITVGSLWQLLPKWRFQRMDLWIVLFLVSITLSEFLRENNFTNAIFTIVNGITSMLFPYIAGRLLIEPGLRLRTVKHFVILILFLSVLGLYELRMGLNPYAIAGSHILDFLPWTLQFRNGWARVATSFSDAELAGIAFVVALTLNSWLVYVNKSDLYKGHRVGHYLAKLERYHIPGLILFGMLYATQSRGPLLGAALAFLILQIPRFKRIRLATIVAALILVSVAATAYLYFDRYTSTVAGNVVSEQQASAFYRRQLLDNYKPIIEEGGWLGWGERSRPMVHGQESIDNEFLLIQVQQGRLGIILFLLIGFDSIWRLVSYIWRFKKREDIYFAICLLAALLSLAATLSTVYLGEQLPQIAFLLIGWSQSLQEDEPDQAYRTAQSIAEKFAFRRVFA